MLATADSFASLSREPLSDQLSIAIVRAARVSPGSTSLTTIIIQLDHRAGPEIRNPGTRTTTIITAAARAGDEGGTYDPGPGHRLERARCVRDGVCDKQTLKEDLDESKRRDTFP